MKTRMGIVAAALLVIGVPGISLGTTITFQDAAANNNPIAFSYGSDITGNATGFVTTDGTGATPNIELEWWPVNTLFKYQTDTAWSALGTPVHVAQLDTSTASGPTIFFTPDAGFAVEILSFDIGNAADQTESPYSWRVDLRKQSSGDVVASQTTSLLGAGNTETVSFNFTGELGEAYLLQFVTSVGGSYRTAIDNLSFAQAVPEPSTNLMLVLGASAIGFFRFRPGRSRKAVSGC